MFRTHARIDAEDLRLARLAVARIAASRAVVVEEAVQPRAVHEDVARVQHPQAPSVAAVSAALRAVRREVGVVVGGHWREGAQRCWWIWLVVADIVSGGYFFWMVFGCGIGLRCFGLDLPHEDVLRGGKLVLIQSMMLNCCADTISVGLAKVEGFEG